MNLRRFGITKTTIYAFVNFLAGLTMYLANDELIVTNQKLVEYLLMINGIAVFVLRAWTKAPLFILLAILWTPAGLFAGELSVVGPETVRAGKLCILEINTDYPRIEVRGFPADGSHAYFKTEKKIILVPESNNYSFVIAGADDKELKVVTHSIKVGGSPTPGPDKPESDLATLVANWGQGLEQTREVGQNFLDEAAKPYSTLDDLLVRTTAANNKVIISKDQWLNTFFIPLQDYLERTYNANPQTDFIPIWREIGAKLQTLGH